MDATSVVPATALTSFLFLLLVLGLCTAGLVGTWALVLYASAMRLVLAALALAVTVGVGWILWSACGACFGVTRLRFEGNTFHHVQKIGPFRWRHDRVALARLLSFEAIQNPQKNNPLVWRSANLGKVEVGLEGSPEIHAMLREVLATMAVRLPTVGRTVETGEGG